MSEADDSAKEPEVQSQPPASDQPAANPPAVDAQDSPPKEKPPVSDVPDNSSSEPTPTTQPAESKPEIQLGNEQFSGSSQTGKETPPAEKDLENPVPQVESGPHKILQELEKDIAPPAEEVIAPAAGETTLSVPETIDIPSLESEPLPPTDVSTPSSSAEELISDAMHRLDEVLKRIKESRSEA